MSRCSSPARASSTSSRSTPKKSYPYYDTIGLDLFEIDFIEEEEQDGEIYKYSMTVPPQNLYENTLARHPRWPG